MKRPATVRLGFLGVGAVVCFVALVIVPPAVFLARREAWLAEFDRPAIRAAWDEFRSDMRRQSTLEGPVQHKVPKSAEPPLLVWLRDHAWLAVAAWVTLGGTLGLVIVGLAIGAARSGSAPQNQPTGDRHDDEQHHRDPEHTHE